jgi:hypothetical protein
MKRIRWGLGLAAAIAIATTLVWWPWPAEAGDKLTVTVALPNGSPAPSGTSVQFLDSKGKAGTCSFLKLGTFNCITTGAASSSLLLVGGTQFGYAESLTGTANINGFTNFGVNQIYQAWSTSPAAQWSSPTPLQITQPMLNSANGLMDRTFLQPLTDYKITPALTYNYFTAKYNFTSGLGKLLPQLTYLGADTAAETIQTTLPGGINFSATATAITPTFGSVSRWTVQAGDASTYQSAYAIYPASSDAPAVMLGVNQFLKHFLATLHHEGALLDSTNLNIYSPSFFENGNDATTQSYLEATRLRKITVKGFSIGSIASFKENVPTSGTDLIGINVIRSSLNHGVPCIDDCCITFVCGSDGSNCLEYGNQRIGSFMLRSYQESDYSGPTPIISSILTAGGIAPTGTVSGYGIDDLDGIFNSTTIPFVKTELINVKPFHNGPSFPLSYDSFYIKKNFTPPVPPADLFSPEIDPITGTPQAFTAYPPPSTTETFKLLSPTSFNGSDFFGKTVKFTYALPLTFLVNSQFASGVECNSMNQTKILNSIPMVLSPGAISVKFKTDKMLGGQPVTGAEYMFSQGALGGPAIKARYFVGTTCNF